MAFQIGDRVQLTFGRTKTVGVVTEDRGSIGAHGRRIYQVAVSLDPADETTFELPEEELEAAATTLDHQIPHKEIIDYLKEGGLLAILQSNASGGRTPPRVWLRLDGHDRVTHTFIEAMGITGGAVAPFWALQNEKIFAPKHDDVVTFLHSFGLSASEAADVISSVGT